MRRHPAPTRPRRGLAEMVGGSHRKGAKMQWQASEGEETGKKGLESETSNKKPDWQKSGCKKTPKTNRSGASSQRRKDTWRTFYKSKWRELPALHIHVVQVRRHMLETLL
ncbi:unnamed protein product [Sphagnum troendelagicum]|uniref:Uncharacterized protein n=1 Tax=Sphagnum troendelagicum TaxID=128251 RepID=A0ABP0TNH1_9BRYO